MFGNGHEISIRPASRCFFTRLSSKRRIVWGCAFDIGFRLIDRSDTFVDSSRSPPRSRVLEKRDRLPRAPVLRRRLRRPPPCASDSLPPRRVVRMYSWSHRQYRRRRTRGAARIGLARLAGGRSQTLVAIPITAFKSGRFVIDIRDATNRARVEETCKSL